MWTRIARLFTIKTKFEAFLIIYGLDYPGVGGWLLFALCPIAVFMAGGRVLDSIERERE
jgi:hypothetical protein